MKNLLITTALCALALTAGAQQNSEPALVTTAGEYTINVAPDEAELNFTVSSKEAAASDAQKANDQIVQKALDYLAGQGIEDKNIRTTRIGLRPYSERINDEETRQLYLAEQSIAVSVADLDKLGPILSGLVDLGVNEIGNVEFKSSKMEKLQAEARVGAVLDARRKAETLARALGQQIGQAYQITDNTSGQGQPRPVMYAMEARAADSSAPMAPGEIEVQAQVTVRFYLK